MAFPRSDLTRLLAGTPEEIGERLRQGDLLSPAATRDLSAVTRVILDAQRAADVEYERRCAELGRDPLEDTGPGFEPRSYVRLALERAGFLNPRGIELARTVRGERLERNAEPGLL